METTVRAIIENVEVQPINNQRRRRRANPYVCIGLAFIVVTGVLLGYVAQKWSIVALGYEVQRRQTELDQLAMENQYLRVQKAAARSPKRIEQIAKERMGMVEPIAPQHIVVQLPTTSPSTVPTMPVEQPRGLLATISSYLGQLLSGDQAVQAGRIGQ